MFLCHQSDVSHAQALKKTLYTSVAPFNILLLASYLSEKTLSKALCTLSHQEHSLQTDKSNDLELLPVKNTSDFWPCATKSFAALEDPKHVQWTSQINQLIYCFLWVLTKIWFRIWNAKTYCQKLDTTSGHSDNETKCYYAISTVMIP